MNFINDLYIRADFIIIILILMILDILSGVIKAFIDKEFSSSVFRQGLFKKVYELIIIIVGYILDYVLQLEYIGITLSMMIIGLETYSIVIENASTYIPIPDFFKNIIINLKEGEKKHD